MKLSTISAAICLSVVLGLAGSQTASAHCWEFGLRVKNTSGGWVGTPIEIWLPNCSTTPVATGSSTSSPGTDGVNFRIDFNSNCPNMPQLNTEVIYVVKIPAWGKAFYLRGHLMPGFPVDDIYTVTPNALTWTEGADVQEAWGYPSATTSQLCMTLVVYQTIPIGDKTTYKMRATASGAPSYSFSWSNATMTTGATTNPSLGIRTCLNSQTVTVTVTVNGTLSKSITIGGYNPLDPVTPAVTTTWGGIKVMYRN